MALAPLPRFLLQETMNALNAIIDDLNSIKIACAYWATPNTFPLQQTFLAPPLLPKYPVAQLPAPTMLLQGALAVATDALAPVSGAKAAGGGKVVFLVLCDGVAWNFV